MHKTLAKSIKISAKIGVILLLLVVVATSCVTFRKSDKSTLKSLKDVPNAGIHYDSISNYSIRYVYSSKSPNKPNLFLVHGAPGSSSAFIDYVSDSTMYEKFNVVSIDRPGYGYSNYGTYSSIVEQANVLSDLVQNFSNSNQNYLVGHSFGGPIVAKAAIELGNMVRGTIMIAPALDPENEKMFWFSKLGYWGSTKWLTSKALRVASKEKVLHSQELKDLQNSWALLNTPILHIHGTKDKIVPYVNVSFSKTHFKPKVLSLSTWEGEGHLIPFKERDKVQNEIIEFIEKHL